MYVIYTDRHVKQIIIYQLGRWRSHHQSHTLCVFFPGIFEDILSRDGIALMLTSQISWAFRYLASRRLRRGGSTSEAIEKSRSRPAENSTIKKKARQTTRSKAQSCGLNATKIAMSNCSRAMIWSPSADKGLNSKETKRIKNKNPTSDLGKGARCHFRLNLQTDTTIISKHRAECAKMYNLLWFIHTVLKYCSTRLVTLKKWMENCENSHEWTSKNLRVLKFSEPGTHMQMWKMREPSIFDVLWDSLSFFLGCSLSFLVFWVLNTHIKTFILCFFDVFILFLRVEFLLKTDSEYPRDAEVALFTLALSFLCFEYPT